ncbi:hypothetical protein [Xenorhabdus bovienii]|uniref:hypothetical protein n=1 Tax=Xenorhabdus bovienii TaxID=40576 RepID=UPI0023B270B3|nr:hypothetical protein [Xenorhabdus bovienii]MDE9430787.1 hypothetical protein [Xenorhabdus bovienii]MDE9488430.1 hypothetical protein [Xenorhabdus bovienii]MDE9504809.1 hypothetical protein [Xenorhabdus bovienii]
MSNQDALFHRVKDDIHFDTLLEQAHQVVEQQAGKLWSDTAEHDPGITLLEGLSYGVSDLAYRHTLPLTDLLTPAPDEQKGGIFPAEFGPHNTLTCGPVTIDDYRKALLDLHSSDWPEKGSLRDEEDFLFRNVQLVREPTENRYTYWYDATKREYSFVKREGATEFTLRGNYWLYLEPTRQTQENLATATRQLNDFLTKNRNIGESISQIIWSKPVDFPLSLEIELADDVQDIAGIFAAVYSTAEQYLMPEAQRYRTETLQSAGMSNDEIFEGPRLEHGWIPELPAARDYTERLTLNLSRLVNKLLEIKGIQNVNRLRLDNGFNEELIEQVKGEAWSWSIKEGYYPRLWGEDPLQQLAQHDGPLRVIAKGGISVTVSEEQIQSRLPRQSLIQNKPVVLAYGQHRCNVGRYHPVSDTLPSCYGLQLDLAESEHAQRLLPLHQFMLPFEQLLACGCQQIAMLPQLLAFQRKGYEVRGDQWPFKSGSINDDAHKNYAPALQALLKQIANDSDHELDIVNYLLGYFGTQRAPRTFTTPIEDFRAVQQGYLAQQPTLTYHRANIRIDQVSSLQKRIAARMGLGGELFKPEPDLSKLPFYLVEHRALLPIKPNKQFDEVQTPESMGMGIGGDERYLIIKQAGIDGKLRKGQRIDLILFGETPGEKRLTIHGQIVTEIGKGKFWLGNSPQLEQYWLLVSEAIRTKQLVWQNSQFAKGKMPDSVIKEPGSRYLVIEQVGIGINLTQGQVIDLILYKGEQKKNGFTIRGQMVIKTEEDKIWLDVGNSAQLEHNLERVMAAAKKKQLFWQNSEVWMEDMNYRLAYDSDQSLLLKNQKRLTRTAQTPFPAMIAVGNEITLTKVSLEQASSDESEKLHAKVVSFDRIKGTLIIDSQDLSKFPKPEEAWQYSWHFSGKEYEKTDHFSFVISIVVNRDLIEKLPNVDPYKLEEWVKETILTEFPAHISMIIHWMDQDTFSNFGHTYQHWQNNGAPLGDAAYSILESLTLGKLPSSLKGIGTMRIATPKQSKEMVDEWDIKKIIQDELFYIPKESKE